MRSFWKYIFLLIFTFLIFFSSANLIAQNGQNSFNGTFYICATAFGNPHNSNQYADVLSLNLWHEYPLYGTNLQLGWINRAPHDLLGADISTYQNEIYSIYDANLNDGMRTLLHRVKIDYLAMGQRSDYKCVPLPMSDDRWFYSYNIHEIPHYITDNSQFGNHQQVVFCQTLPTGPGGDQPGFGQP